MADYSVRGRDDAACIPTESVDSAVDVYTLVAARTLRRRHLTHAQKAAIASGLRETSAAGPDRCAHGGLDA